MSVTQHVPIVYSHNLLALLPLRQDCCVIISRRTVVKEGEILGECADLLTLIAKNKAALWHLQERSSGMYPSKSQQLEGCLSAFIYFFPMCCQLSIQIRRQEISCPYTPAHSHCHHTKTSFKAYPQQTPEDIFMS